MPGIMSQTRAVEARVQAMSPALNSEPMMGGGTSVEFIVSMDEYVLIKEQRKIFVRS